MALTKIDDRGLKTPIDLLDNEQIRFGTGNDVQIYHDGSNSFIQNATGDFKIKGDNIRLRGYSADEMQISTYVNGTVALAYDGVQKFETTSYGTLITGECRASGSFQLLDYDGSSSGLMKFGAGDDLKIYHDGSHANIYNATGELRIRGGGEGTIRLMNAAGNEHCLIAEQNAAVSLYYDHSKKFETLSAGVRVASGNLYMYDSGEIICGNGNDLKIYHDGSGSRILNTTGTLYIQPKSGENGIQLIPDGAVRAYHDNIKTFETTANGIKVSGPDTGAAIIDLQSDEGQHNSDWWRLYVEDGGPFYLKNYKDGAWENNIVATGAGAVELYYDNEKVLSTTAAGILVENTNGNGELTIRGSEGNGALLYLHADDGDDNADKWRLDGSSDGSFGIQNYTSGSWEKSIKCIGDGAVELYYDNTVRLATNSNGIEVNGHVWLGDGEHVKFGAGTNGDLQIYHDASSSHILNGTGDLLLKSTGWISHACDNGQYWYNAAYNSVYARLDSDGLKFNGDTAAVNALDDYEEGTWTPTVFSSSAGTFSHANQFGTYTKIGRQVYVGGLVNATVSGTETGNARISGLPFTSLNNSGNYGQLITTDYGNFDSYTGHVGGYLNKGDTNIILLHTFEGNSAALATSDWGTGTYIYFSMTYQASA